MALEILSEDPITSEPHTGWYVGSDNRALVVQGEDWKRSVVCPHVRDFSCGERSLTISPSSRPISPEFLQVMSGAPLEPISLSRFVLATVDSHAADRAQPVAPAAELSDIFDISRHPQVHCPASDQRVYPSLTHFPRP